MFMQNKWKTIQILVKDEQFKFIDHLGRAWTGCGWRCKTILTNVKGE